MKVLLVKLGLLPSCGNSLFNITPLPLAAGLLARLHSDDPVPAGGLLHLGGFHPDDRVGQGEAPQLPEGVPRLPSSPLTHPALRPVEDCSTAPSPLQLSLFCRSQVHSHLSNPNPNWDSALPFFPHPLKILELNRLTDWRNLTLSPFPLPLNQIFFSLPVCLSYWVKM